MSSMNLQEFDRVVRIGLGRAVLHLQTHDTTSYRDVILDACLHSSAYDRQLEPGREQYLFDLIVHTGEPEFYRDRLLHALLSADHTQDGEFAAVVRLFAEHGDAQARQRLYDVFAANPADNTSDLPGQIVEMDGAQGLLFVAERLPIESDESWYPGHLIWLAGEKYGPDTTARALAEAAETNPSVASYLAACERRAKPKPDLAAMRRRRREEAADYERLRQRLQEGDGQALSLLRSWGREASDEELVRAASDMLAATDERVLRAYLRLFHMRRFPLDPAPLLELSRSSDEMTAHAALYALTQVSHTSVRALALDLLARDDGRGAALFVGNYEDGDYGRIAGALLSWEDLHAMHTLGHNLRKVAEAHPTPNAAPALLALYERGPCSLCRRHAIELLQEIASVPDWMRAECHYDASPDIRAMTFE